MTSEPSRRGRRPLRGIVACCRVEVRLTPHEYAALKALAMANSLADTIRLVLMNACAEAGIDVAPELAPVVDPGVAENLPRG